MNMPLLRRVHARARAEAEVAFFNVERKAMKNATTTTATTNTAKSTPTTTANPVDVTLDEHDAGTLPAVGTPAHPKDASSRPLLASAPRVEYLDPSTIYEGSGPNRDESAFVSEQFEQLALSILAMGGNTTAIEVRPVTTADELPAGGPYQYVLISGARRLRACRQHQLQVYATVNDKLTPLEESLRRLAENFNRESPCAIELGWQVQFIRTQYPEAKLSDAAIGRMIGVDKSIVSKALTLASLPRKVIDCFESVDQLRYADAKPLADAFTAAPEEVLAAAVQIRAGQQLKASEVLERLTNAAANAPGAAATKPKKTGVERFNAPLEAGGKVFGDLTQTKAGDHVITLQIALTEAHRMALSKHITSFVRSKVMGLKPEKGMGKGGKPATAIASTKEAQGAPS
ncbi:ParB/RepB/Spo0J family partition protein [Ramlibacter sp. MMS24-I3-19]|uniref:ParB/RepB/Spo0J family partition protein n=1 Tax=Ramlibacter sp. MMS24-I3-19 TaxID=3416606 RepID=UPI003D002BA3